MFPVCELRSRVLTMIIERSKSKQGKQQTQGMQHALHTIRQ
jgi:hypothetical protein